MSVSDSVRVLQFGDSVFPIGAFNFSAGLESAVQQGVVKDLETLRSFVHTMSRRAARCDGVALLEAHRAARSADADRVYMADGALLERTLGDEQRHQLTRTGKKLAETCAFLLEAPVMSKWLDQIQAGGTPGTYPVGIGVLFADLRLDEEDAFGVHQHATVRTILSAALRLIRIDYREVEALLFEVLRSIPGQPRVSTRRPALWPA